jgi:hypothetical protein
MKMCKCGCLPRTPSGFFCKLCSGERNRQRGHLKIGSPEHRERMRAAMLRRLQDQEATDRRFKALRATMASEEYRDKILKSRAERDARSLLRAVESARRLNERAIRLAEAESERRPEVVDTVRLMRRKR